MSNKASVPLAEKAHKPVSQRDLAFKFRGGTPCLLLVETLGEWTGRRYERIHSSALWSDWLRKAKLPAPSRAASEEELREMRELRAAMRGVAEAIRTGQRPLAADIACINRFADHAPPFRPLDAAGTGLTAPRDVTTRSILALLAQDAVALFGSDQRDRIKQCISPTCPVLFLDRSRCGDRIWCSTTCGARLATARYRRRLSAEAEA